MLKECGFDPYTDTKGSWNVLRNWLLMRSMGDGAVRTHSRIRMGIGVWSETGYWCRSGVMVLFELTAGYKSDTTSKRKPAIHKGQGSCVVWAYMRIPREAGVETEVGYWCGICELCGLGLYVDTTWNLFGTINWLSMRVGGRGVIPTNTWIHKAAGEKVVVGNS